MHISVIGAGWLGTPLALHLAQHGHTLNVTKRHDGMLNKDIKAHAFDWTLERSWLNLAFAQHSDVCVLNIPGGRRSQDLSDYTAAMQRLVQHLRDLGCKHLLFISSTSVYGEASGRIIETTEPKPLTASARANLTIEHAVKDIYAAQATVLRLAGLVGHDRHPVVHLAGKEVDDANSPVNLIHQADVIHAISRIIDTGLWGETLHLCCEKHPTREEYYTACARQRGLAIPTFTQHQQATRWIDASQTLATLGLTPQFPDPMDFCQ